MQIISKFKDYYDYFSTIYGVEKKFVFNRTAQLPKKVTMPFFNLSFERILRSSYARYNLSVLVVCGKAFLLYQYLSYENKKDILITEASDHQEVWERFFKQRHKRYVNIARPLKYDELFNIQHQELVELSKRVGSPVFIIKGVSFGDNKTRIFSIQENIPNLSDLNLARVYPGDQLYQDIEYFISNILKDAPDTEPPVQIDDKTKISKHGFDVKKSFRHR